MSRVTEKSEIKRLKALYAELPPKKKALAEGLIVEAARLRVRLDSLWASLQESGEISTVQQSPSAPPFDRESPESKIYSSTNKLYQSIIKQLSDMLPAEKVETTSSLDKFRDNA